jgi:hypothetical protein
MYNFRFSKNETLFSNNHLQGLFIVSLIDFIDLLAKDEVIVNRQP